MHVELFEFVHELAVCGGPPGREVVWGDNDVCVCARARARVHVGCIWWSPGEGAHLPRTTKATKQSKVCSTCAVYVLCAKQVVCINKQAHLCVAVPLGDSSNTMWGATMYVTNRRSSLVSGSCTQAIVCVCVCVCVRARACGGGRVLANTSP